MVQLLPTGKLAGQLLVCEKLVLSASVMEEICKGSWPVEFTVTVAGEDELPTMTELNVRPFG